MTWKKVMKTSQLLLAFVKSAIKSVTWVVKCLCCIPLVIAFALFLALIDFFKEQRAKKIFEEQRRKILNNEEDQNRLKVLIPREGYILVTGGTYGHKLLFDALAETDLHNVVLQTGQIDPKPYIQKHPEWVVFTLTEYFEDLIANAEVVITHFGETILEVVAYKKPCVIVPNPEWTRTAGLEDAKIFAKKVNAVLVSNITKENLLTAVEEAKKKIPPKLLDGAENLAKIILDLM